MHRTIWRGTRPAVSSHRPAPAHADPRGTVNDYSDMGTQRMGTDATVIICTHNRADRLASVLADLRTMKLSPGTSWEIIVADNWFD